MNKLTLKQLLLLTAGVMAGIILLGAVAVNVFLKPKSQKVVTQKYQAAEINESRHADIAIDQVNAKLEEISNRTEANQQEWRNDIQGVMAGMSNINQNMDNLDQRLTFLEESRRPVHVKVVKPKAKNDASKTTRASRSRSQAPKALAGYKVNAIVGHRAWLQENSREVSLTTGDQLNGKKPYKVKSVDAANGIIYFLK